MPFDPNNPDHTAQVSNAAGAFGGLANRQSRYRPIAGQLATATGGVQYTVAPPGGAGGPGAPPTERPGPPPAGPAPVAPPPAAPPPYTGAPPRRVTDLPPVAPGTPGGGPQPFAPPGPPNRTGTTPPPGPFTPPPGRAPAPTTPPVGPPAPPVTPPPYDPTALDIGNPSGSTRLDEDYDPGAPNPRLTGARTATDAAGRAVLDANYNTELGGNEARYRQIFGTGAVEGGPDVAATDSARTAGYGSAQDRALEGLTGGPNRTELARQALTDFDTEGERGLQDRFRRVGQQAAKFGQMGLGDVNAQLGSIQGDYERNRLQERNRLIRDVSEGDINDRYRTVGAVSGLRGQEAALDTGRRGETRTERAYDTDTGRYNAEQDFERRMAATSAGRAQTGAAGAERQDQLGAAGTLEDRVYGQGQGAREEARTERQYQQGEAQRTIDNRLAQRRAQDEAEQLRIRRALALQGAGGQAPWDAAWGGQ